MTLQNLRARLRDHWTPKGLAAFEKVVAAALPKGLKNITWKGAAKTKDGKITKGTGVWVQDASDKKYHPATVRDIRVGSDGSELLMLVWDHEPSTAQFAKSPADVTVRKPLKKGDKVWVLWPSDRQWYSGVVETPLASGKVGVLFDETPEDGTIDMLAAYVSPYPTKKP